MLPQAIWHSTPDFHMGCLCLPYNTPKNSKEFKIAEYQTHWSMKSLLSRNDQSIEYNITSKDIMVRGHKYPANLQVLVSNMKHDSLSFHLIPKDLSSNRT